jgi:hypothetical protein
MLSANPGYFPDGYSVSYQWRHNGVNINGQNSDVLWLQPSDVGQRISLVFTAVKDGSPTITKIATNPNIVRLGEMPDFGGVRIYSYNDSFTLWGELYTGVTDSMNLDPYATISYTWLRNGVPFISDYGSQYLIGLDDLGKNLSFRVTETRDGYKTITHTSPVIAVPKFAVQPDLETPTIFGDAVYGQTLSYYAATGCMGCHLNYVWQRNGVAITGTENQTEYTLGLSDIGTRLTVKVTSTMLGSNPISRVSGKTAVVSRARFTEIGTPYITIYSPKVGDVEFAGFPALDPQADITYQWLRDNRPIAGATDSSYTLTSLDARRRISVKIGASALGYIPVTLVSNNSQLVQP